MNYELIILWETKLLMKIWDKALPEKLRVLVLVKNHNYEKTVSRKKEIVFVAIN